MAGEEYYFADSHDELRKAIRENIHFGANVIKLIADDQEYIYSEEDVRFVVKQAALSGLKVAVHTTTDEAAVNAIKGGAHTLEHGNDFEKRETFQLMRKQGLYFVTTSIPRNIWQAMASTSWQERDENEFEEFFQERIIAILRRATRKKLKLHLARM